MFNFSADVLFQLGFFIALGAFTIHGLILSYHWLTYGANRSQSLMSLAIYLVGGSSLLLALSISLSYI